MRIDGYHVRHATLEDAPAVQALLALDPATYELLESAPLRPDEAHALLTKRPPGVPPERLYNFLIESPDLPPPGLLADAAASDTSRLASSIAAPAALLSLVEGFPDERTWYLGLIFLAPAARGAGLGTRAIEALCAHALEHGGAALRLAVVPANTGARRFYDRLGFAFVARRPRISWNGATGEVDVLERRLR